MKLNTFTFRITESKNPDYKVGEVVVAMFGWRTHTIVGESVLTHTIVGESVVQSSTPIIRRVDPSISLSTSTAVGILGMPG